jgi:hypothetical protein
MELNLLEKPTVVQLLKNFPTFYETQRFISIFTGTSLWNLSFYKCTKLRE